MALNFAFFSTLKKKESLFLGFEMTLLIFQKRKIRDKWFCSLGDDIGSQVEGEVIPMLPHEISACNAAVVPTFP